MRGKQTVVPQVEVLWRWFEEANLMDSSTSDFKGEANSMSESSMSVSLMEESDMLRDGRENGGRRGGRKGEGKCRRGGKWSVVE